MRSQILALVLSAFAVSAAVGCSATTDDDVSASEQDIVGADREALMNALRAPVKQQLNNQDIVFNVQGEGRVLRTQGDWAWLQGAVQLRNGGEPTTVGTIYEVDAKEGLFDGFRIEALLQRSGGGWKVVQFGIGSTDVWYWGIDESYPAAPKEIFPWRDAVPGLEHAEPENRRVIMDTLRADLKPSVGGQDIVFNVRKEHGVFRMAEGWVWMQGDVELRTGGEPKGADEWQDGWHFEALMQKVNGKWKVEASGIGSTDVWWSGIDESHPTAPKQIFPWHDK